MPSTGIGLYPGSATAVENDQVSSTYEGRHLTFLEADILGHEHTWPTKGHPVVVGEHIVGVVLAITRTDGTIGAEANAVTDLIAIDTEGIWNLSVVATDEDGDNAVVAGDELFIHKTSGIISKNYNKNTHTRFGYALGGIAGGSTYVIAVKVHWTDDDEEELVGQSDAIFVNADVSHRFREYHYEAQGGTYPHGDHLELTISTLPCVSAQALVRKLLWTNDTNLITGYAAVGEFELVIGGGNGLMDTTSILRLTSSVGTLVGTDHNAFAFGWIYIEEYTTREAEQCNNIFLIVDTDGDYPYTNDPNNLFTASSGDLVVTHTLKFLVNGTKYWILCRSAN